jgi:hypothetical protein
MAINTIVDNAVIDFTQITSILETLKSHDDLYVTLAAGNMASIQVVDSTSNQTPAAPAYISAGNLSFAGVKYGCQLSAGKATATGVKYGGVAFGATPVVVATAKLIGTSSTIFPTVHLTDIQGDSCSFIVHDTSGAKSSAIVEVQILAFGLATKTVA